MLLQKGKGEAKGQRERRGRRGKKKKISGGLPYVVQIHEGGKRKIRGKGGEKDGGICKARTEDELCSLLSSRAGRGQ